MDIRVGAQSTQMVEVPGGEVDFEPGAPTKGTVAKFCDPHSTTSAEMN